MCRACRVAGVKKTRAKNPEQYRQYQLSHRASIWSKIVAAYGGKCACCGRTDRLELDHVNGGGRKHRASNGWREIWRQVIDAGFPDTFQLLCAPCNTGKGIGTHCDIPEHQQYRH